MRGRRRIATGVVGMLAASVVLLGAGVAGAQDRGTPDAAADATTTDSSPTTAEVQPAVEEPVGVTTTTLPEDDSELGRIIPLPNSGREPTSPGDRGGWQQVTLFFAICAVIIGIGAYVWWRGRRNRAQLRARGVDRVEWARSHGGDVRDGAEH